MTRRPTTIVFLACVLARAFAGASARGQDLAKGTRIPAAQVTHVQQMVDVLAKEMGGMSKVERIRVLDQYVLNEFAVAAKIPGANINQLTNSERGLARKMVDEAIGKQPDPAPAPTPPPQPPPTPPPSPAPAPEPIPPPRPRPRPRPLPPPLPVPPVARPYPYPYAYPYSYPYPYVVQPAPVWYYIPTYGYAYAYPYYAIAPTYLVVPR